MTKLLFDNPAPLFIAIFLVAFAFYKNLKPLSSKRVLHVGVASGSVSAFAYLAIVALNITRPGFLWHDEANILSTVAAYTHGQPLYHPITGALFYSLFYGPTTFLVYAPFFAATPRPLLPIMTTLFVVNVMNLILLYCIARKWLSRSAALASVPLVTAFLMAYPGILLGVRGDIWLLFCMSAALLIAVRWSASGWWVASLLAGILSGLAIDVKGTMALVACLLIAILYRRYGRGSAMVGAASCATTALGIFLLPQISLRNYLAWLVVSGHQRFLKSTCLSNIVATVFLLAPIYLIATYGSAKLRSRGLGRAIPGLFFVSMAICVVTGSKDGAGGWHLWALLPFALLALAHEISLRGEIALSRKAPGDSVDEGANIPASRTSIVLASIAIGATAVTLMFAAKDFRVVRPPADAAWRMKQAAAHAEMAELLARDFSGQNLSMGYGSAVTDYRSDLRYELAAAGHPYFFDENAVVEGIKAGFPIPAEVSDRVLGCEDIWVIPHGEIPFSALRTGVLPITSTPSIFPDNLRLGFVATHSRFQQGQVYDLWKCSGATAGR